MKIAHVLRRLSFDDWGGTEQVVWNLARAQAAAGHEVRLFATTALCKEESEVVGQLGSAVVKQSGSGATTQPPNHLTT